MLTKIMLFLFLAGCAYYPEQSKINQIHLEEKICICDTYFDQMTSSQIQATVLDDYFLQENTSCSLQLSAIEWLFRHQHFVLTSKRIDTFLKDLRCQPYYDAAIFQKIQLLFEKQRVDEGIALLKPFIANPQHPFYQESLSFLGRMIKRKNVFTERKHDINFMIDYFNLLQKEGTDASIYQAYHHPFLKNSITSYESLPLYEHVIFLYQGSLSEGIMNGLVEFFEKQSVIQSINFLNIDDQQDDIFFRLMTQPNSLLVAYRLKNPLLTRWASVVHKAILIESDIEIRGSSTYSIDFSIKNDLDSLTNPLMKMHPQLVLYDQSHESYLQHDALKNARHVMIDKTDFQQQIKNILSIQERKEFFEEFLQEPIHYIQLPTHLPDQIFLLLEPDLTRLVYPYLIYWGQQKTTIMSTQKALSGDLQLDKTLNGMWILMNPLGIASAPDDHQIGEDLLNIINHLSWYHLYDQYAYHGELGRYVIRDDKIHKQLTLLKYKSR